MGEPQVYDFIVIGAGSGGVRAARIAAGHGAKVAVVESSRLGGTCVNLGCVPKKLMAYAGHFAQDFKDAAGYGWTTQQTFNWSTLIANKNQEIERLNSIYGGMLERAGVQLFRGVGRYLKQENQLHQIQCEQSDGTVTLTAKRVLIATGGRPSTPPIEGAEHLLVSDDLFYLNELPKSMTMIGAGYIAVEFASIFAGLGVQVNLVLRGTQLLRSFDHQLGAWLEAAFEAKGIQVYQGAGIEKIEALADKGFALHFSYNGQQQRMVSDVIVAATGRSPNLPGGLEASIPDLLDQKGFIKVNQKYETAMPGVYAVGDLLNGPALTPVAIKQGQWLADALFKDQDTSVLSIPSIPTAVFTHPAIGTVGLGEQELSSNGTAFKVFKSEFRPMKHTLAGNPLKVGIKLLVSDDDEMRVLGMHMFGDEAPEIIQGLAVAFDMGVTKAQLDQTLGVHPTVGEEWVTLK